jgi:hypothetical protein
MLWVSSGGTSTTIALALLFKPDRDQFAFAGRPNSKHKCGCVGEDMPILDPVQHPLSIRTATKNRNSPKDELRLQATS